MDATGLRGSVETLLGLVDLLASGVTITSKELKDIEKIAATIRAGLAVTPGETKRFPGGHWVFRVRRTQCARFSVEGKDYDYAHTKAAEHLHDNIEALRFTWDTSNPYDLSPLELEREPGDLND